MILHGNKSAELRELCAAMNQHPRTILRRLNAVGLLKKYEGPRDTRHGQHKRRAPVGQTVDAHYSPGMNTSRFRIADVCKAYGIPLARLSALLAGDDKVLSTAQVCEQLGIHPRDAQQYRAALVFYRPHTPGRYSANMLAAIAGV